MCCALRQIVSPRIPKALLNKGMPLVPNGRAVSSTAGIQVLPSHPCLVAPYLFHGAVHNLLQKAHLHSNHEGGRAADSCQEALRNNRDVGMCPAEGVEQGSSSVDALRQGARTEHEKVTLRGAWGTSTPNPPHSPLPRAAARSADWLSAKRQVWEPHCS